VTSAATAVQTQNLKDEVNTNTNPSKNTPPQGAANTSENQPKTQAPARANNLAHIGQDIFGEGDRTGEIQYYMRALLGGYISNTQLQEKAQVAKPNMLEKGMLFVGGVTPADWIRKAGISRQNLVQMMEVQDKHLDRALKQPSTNPVYKKVIADEKLALKSLILELCKTPIDE